MNIELIGDKKYIDTITANDGVWVLMSRQAVYMLKAGEGNALPTWVGKDEAERFKLDSGRVDLAPVFLPLSSLIGGWLNSTQMQILEVLATPKFGCEALTYAKDELIEIFKT